MKSLLIWAFIAGFIFGFSHYLMDSLIWRNP